MEQKLRSQTFTLDDYLEQFDQLRNMGDLNQLAGMIPGMKPGQLKDVSRIIADLGANVFSMHHERAGAVTDVNGCHLRIELETRNFEHIEEIKKALTDHGFKLL